jgi:hypothetical protein
MKLAHVKMAADIVVVDAATTAVDAADVADIAVVAVAVDAADIAAAADMTANPVGKELKG